MTQRMRLPDAGILLLQLGLFTVLLSCVFGFRLYPYADDWIYPAALPIKTAGEFLAWLLRQHVDHRIPLQKAFQFALLKGTDFDYRILVCANMLLALLTSMLLVNTLKLYRGYRHLGDVMVPLMLMLPTTAYSLWAFELQFLSSVFFVAASVYYACRFGRDAYGHDALLMLLQLFLCALCGLNGLIFSTVLSVAAIACYALMRARLPQPSWFLLASVLALFAEHVALWSAWAPSDASQGPTSLGTLLEVALKLLPASMILFSMHAIYLKIGAVILALLAAAWAVYGAIRKGRLDFSDAYWSCLVLASLAMLFSVALGRSRVQGGWNVGLAMHYSMLTCLLPIAAWALISRLLGSGSGAVAALVGIALYLGAYQENFAWRRGFLNSVQEKQAEVNYALTHQPDVAELVDKYPLDFTWQDSPRAKQLATAGLTALRAAQLPLYTVHAAAPQIVSELTGAAPPLTTQCYGSIDEVNGQSPVSTQMAVRGTLRVTGWLVASEGGLSLPEAVYVVLNDGKGNRSYLATRTQPRPDIADHFKQPLLANAGYLATLDDKSSLNGVYSLGLAIRKKDGLHLCSQFNVAITLEK